MNELFREFDALADRDKAELRRQVRVLVITGLGLNCEAETEAAFRMAGAQPELVHLLDLLEGSGPRKLADYPVLAFIERGGLALGVCNGFQTMTRLGLLPGLDGDYRTPRATLAQNDRAGYRDAWVTLGVDERSPCVWTRGISRIELPARHGEGKFLTAEGVLDRLRDGRQIVARYLDPDGRPTQEWPYNPNGSPDAVAAICDPSGRLFGVMPHPDAHLYPFHHPDFTRRRIDGELPAEGEGMKIFRNGVDAAAALRMRQ